MTVWVVTDHVAYESGNAVGCALSREGAQLIAQAHATHNERIGKVVSELIWFPDDSGVLCAEWRSGHSDKTWGWYQVESFEAEA